ncbi:MAG: hypothetical protein HC837_12965 [Chloroflexaceae bacterium]|nr:hypothetical protein [Chloroflexaceae bacterium]
MPAVTSTTDQTTERKMVVCALTGNEIAADEAYWAPPLVTMGQLFGTIFANLGRPAYLKQILLDIQEDVPYDPSIRDELASRRSSEQIKLLGLLLVIIALIAIPIYFLFIAGGTA